MSSVRQPVWFISTPVLAIALSSAACRNSESAHGRPAASDSATATTSVSRATPASSSARAPEAPLLTVGQAAPNIEADAHNGQHVKLSALRGQPIVVYFYPKDDTPGCTIEAQEIRDDFAELGKQRVTVIGVSADDNDSHRAFAQKHALPFLLLPDPDHRVANAFGVPVVNGHEKRITFLIDSNGKIAKVWSDVTPKGHAAEILAAVRNLRS